MMLKRIVNILKKTFNFITKWCLVIYISPLVSISLLVENKKPLELIFILFSISKLIFYLFLLPVLMGWYLMIGVGKYFHSWKKESLDNQEKRDDKEKKDSSDIDEEIEKMEVREEIKKLAKEIRKDEDVKNIQDIKDRLSLGELIINHPELITNDIFLSNIFNIFMFHSSFIYKISVIYYLFFFGKIFRLERPDWLSHWLSPGLALFFVILNSVLRVRIVFILHRIAKSKNSPFLTRNISKKVREIFLIKLNHMFFFIYKNHGQTWTILYHIFVWSPTAIFLVTIVSHKCPIWWKLNSLYVRASLLFFFLWHVKKDLSKIVRYQDLLLLRFEQVDLEIKELKEKNPFMYYSRWVLLFIVIFLVFFIFTFALRSIMIILIFFLSYFIGELNEPRLTIPFLSSYFIYFLSIVIIDIYLIFLLVNMGDEKSKKKPFYYFIYTHRQIFFRILFFFFIALLWGLVFFYLKLL